MALCSNCILAQAGKRDAGRCYCRPSRTVHFALTASTARPPTQSYENDAGWDLYVSRPALAEPGELVEIHTDINIALPPGYWAHLLGRSSTPRRYGLHIVEAVIDGGYRGELFIAARSFHERPINIMPGMRLVQLVLHEIARVTWAQVDSLGPTERGDNGFGSSGK